MADVFLSYKRDERAAVELIASRLRALDLSVWFDASMSAGETFNAEIDREARAAKAILVCWSPGARQSEWVNAEAMIGFAHKNLAACYVAGPDEFDPPTPFNTSHIEDLRGWLAAPDEMHARWKSVLRRIGKLCGRGDIENWGALDADASVSQMRAWIAAHETSPLFMAVDELLRAREAEEVERTRIVREARDRRATEAADRPNLFVKKLVGPALLTLGGIAIVIVLSLLTGNVERGNIRGNGETVVAATTAPSLSAAENQTRGSSDRPVTTAAGESGSCTTAEAQWAELRSSRDQVRLESFVQETPRFCNARSLALARLVDLRRSPPSGVPEVAAQDQNAAQGLSRPETESASASGAQIGGLVVGSIEQVRVRDGYMIVRQSGTSRVSAGTAVLITTQTGATFVGNVERVTQDRFSVTVRDGINSINEGDAVRAIVRH